MFEGNKDQMKHFFLLLYKKPYKTRITTRKIIWTPKEPKIKHALAASSMTALSTEFYSLTLKQGFYSILFLFSLHF